jgi:transcriptional regulator with XRE-family HTH domain
MPSPSPRLVANPFGQLLQRWRRVRGKSQLDLAMAADVSPRHVSFVETGRSTPSRPMVMMLASALDVPLRERNALLVAAGYAPVYRETRLDAPELEPARRALELILRHQEPYPAVVMNRRWDIVTANDAARGFFSFLLGDAGPAPAGPPNVLRLMFDPRGLRPHVTNWEEVAEALVQRVHREAVGGVADDETSALLREILAYPGVPTRWRSPDPTLPLAPFVPVSFRKQDVSARYFSAVTTLGTPQDVTLQELRVECFYPADAETERQAARLRDARAAPAIGDVTAGAAPR